MKRLLLVLSLLLLAAVAVGYANAQSAPGPCDRACLEGFVDRYFDAAIAHDPSLLPLAKDVKFTENGQRLILPDAHWKTMISKGKYRLFVTDPDAGQVAFLGTIREEGNTPEGIASPIAVRLKVKNRKIAEIETLVIRPTTQSGPSRGTGAAPAAPQGPAANIEKMGAPHHLFTDVIPQSERMSRADLIRVADMYFRGMEKNDGKGLDGTGTYPFTDDCERFENGGQSTNVPLREGQAKPDPKTSSSYSSAWGCREQFESGLIHFVWRIRDRRFVAVDQERGWTDGHGRPGQSMDLADCRNVQNREGQNPPDRSYSHPVAIWDELGVEHLAGWLVQRSTRCHKVAKIRGQANY
jgi:hypothetical protein